MFSPLTQQLIDSLCYLPGIGNKTAQRLAFYLLDENRKDRSKQLANSILEAIEKIGKCQQCQTYTEFERCEICTNTKRNSQLCCVVESPADIPAIEQTHSYNGHYFVLHGKLSPLDGIGPDDIGIPSLINQVKTLEVKELIIATNPTMEGKATAHYIADQLKAMDIKLSRIAFGVPLGGEIEYLDGNTLAHAFASRQQFNDSPS